jgi:hypothetical protein
LLLELLLEFELLFELELLLEFELLFELELLLEFELEFELLSELELLLEFELDSSSECDPPWRRDSKRVVRSCAPTPRSTPSRRFMKRSKPLSSAAAGVAIAVVLTSVMANRVFSIFIGFAFPFRSHQRLHRKNAPCGDLFPASKEIFKNRSGLATDRCSGMQWPGVVTAYC